MPQSLLIFSFLKSLTKNHVSAIACASICIIERGISITISSHSSFTHTLCTWSPFGTPLWRRLHDLIYDLTWPLSKSHVGKILFQVKEEIIPWIEVCLNDCESAFNHNWLMGCTRILIFTSIINDQAIISRLWLRSLTGHRQRRIDEFLAIYTDFWQKLLSSREIILYKLDPRRIPKHVCLNILDHETIGLT